MTNILDVSDTVAPKSDQINFDDVAVGQIQATVTRVTKTDGDQPVSIHFDQGLRPYKPCKSMRRVLIHAWGGNGNDWVGRSMIIFGDPDVRFGGQAVGGIRISHLSHIDKDMNFMLTVTRARRAAYSVKKLTIQKETAQQSAPAQKPAPDFEESFDRIVASIKEGKNTIEKTEQYFFDNGAALTADQKKKIKDATEQDQADQAAVEEDVF